MQDPDVYERLLPHLEKYDIALGAWVLGQSRLGMTVLGDEQDEPRFSKVYATVWPSRDRWADGAAEKGRALHCFRDAMHVDNAIKYAATGLVTEDKDLLKADERVRMAFDGFRIVNIAEATRLCVGRARAVRSAAQVHGRPAPATIPDWPV